MLILDEPTGSLDSDARRVLLADLLAVTEGRATLLITQELDALDQLDKIVVLDRDRMVERRSQQQLIRAGRRYLVMSGAAAPRAG